MPMEGRLAAAPTDFESRCERLVAGGINQRLPSSLQIQVGHRIKNLREAEGVSQETFAPRIGMNRSYLASIETSRRNLTLQNLAKIAQGFGITLSQFLEGIG